METVPISGRIEKEASDKLALLAKVTARSKSFLVNEAIKAYVEEQAWQIEAINEGIKAANEGKFASDEEVRNTFAKYGVNIDED